MEDVRVERLIVGVVLAIVVVVLISGFVARVPVNSTGIKYSNIRGTISEEPLDSGMHLKLPFVDRVTNVSTELRSADIDDVRVTTRDAQSALIDVEIQYSILPENAVRTFKQFRSVPEEDWINVFVYQRIQRGLQESASEFDVNEIMGSKRGEFQAAVDETIRVALEENNLTLHSASVDDIDVSATIKQSIEDNAKARQEVKTAQQNKLRSEVENQTRVEKAEADAEVRRVESEAEANANLKLSNSLSAELVSYLEAQARQEHGWYLYNNMKPNVITNEK